MRHTGIDVIGDVPWGTHFCQFYETSQDLVETLVPYFKAGLEANEFCMWVTSAPLPVRQAKAALKAAVPDLDRRVRRGQIEIIDYKKWYVRSGKFSADEVLKGWADKLDKALAKGYEGLRLSGNAFWLEQADWEDFRKYEETVNNVIGRHKMMALCTYSLKKCGASEIMDVVANHEFALVKRKGRWEMIRSSQHIAEKVRGEESSKKATLKYSTVIETTQSGYWLFDMEGRLLEVNDAYCRLSGYSQAELLNMRISDLEAMETPADVLNHLRLVREHGHHQFESRHRRKDGSLFDVEVRASYLGIEGGRFVAFVWDISDRKRIEQSLRDSEARFKLLSETAGRLLEVENPQKVIEGVCRKVMAYLDCQAFFNFLADERAGRLRLNACAGIPEEEARRIEWLDYGVAVCGCVAREGARIVAEEIPTTRDPRTDLVRSCGIQAYACHPLLSRGQVIGTLSFGTRTRTRFSEDELSVMKTVADQVAIAMERKRTEEALRRNEATLRGILDATQESIWLFSPDGIVLTANETALRRFGKTAGEVTGRHFTEILTPELARSRLESLNKVIVSNQPTESEDQRAGMLFHHSWYPVRDDQGRVTSVACFSRDITERKQAEAGIGYQAQLLGQVQDGIIGADPETRITYWNKGAEHLYGFTEAEALGKTTTELLSPEYAPGEREKIMAELARLGASRATIRTKHKNGADVIAEVHSTRLTDESGVISGYVVAYRDVTERRLAEQELRRTREHLENLINFANAPIIVWDPQFKITRFNHAFERLTGLRAEEVIGKPLDILFPETTRDESLAHIKRTLAGERWEVVEIPILKTDGSIRTVLWNSANIYDQDGTTITATIAQGQDITERKKAEEELRRTREHLESLIDYANAPIIVWDPQFRITRFNHAFERLTGLKAEHVIGRPLEILFPEASRDESLAHIKRTLTGERWEIVDIPILRTDGAVRTVLWNSANIYDKDGTTLAATIAQGQDITERKQAEEDLRRHALKLEVARIEATNEKYRLEAVMESLPVGVAITDIRGGNTKANSAYNRIWGTPRPEAASVDDYAAYKAWWSDTKRPVAVEEWASAQVIKKGEPVVGQMFEIQRFDGSRAYVINSAAPVRDASGNLTGSVVAIQDITDLRRFQEALRLRTQELQQLTETLEQRVRLRTAELAKANELLQAEVTHSHFVEADLKNQKATLQTVIDNIPIMLCFFDSSGKAMLTNREFKRLLGWSEEEAGHLAALALPPDTSGLSGSQGQDTGGIPGWRENRIRTRAGEEMDSSWAAVRLSDGGQIRIGIDMRERKAAEQERLRLAAAVEQAQEGIAITDSKGFVIYANPAVEETLGIARAELMGLRYYDFLTGEGDARNLGEAALKILESGEAWNAHLTRKKKSEQTIELDVRLTPIRDRSGNIINHLVAERDVTRDVRLQQHLRQVQKMEALGTLAGGIAHDFNNILNPIFINTELALMDAPLDEASRRELEIVLKAAERGRDLVKQIITFSRQKEKERRPSKVGPVLKEALKFLRSSLAATVEIRQNIDPESGYVMADPSQIHQVVMNLCNNAAYAMRERGGVLGVGLAEVEVDEDMAIRYPNLKPGPYLRLTVSDTGAGMTRQVMDRAFDPFFTTKKPGEGSGMGLAVVHGIVRDYGGTITVYSEVGKGTTFNIFFPRVPSEEVQPQLAVEALPGGGKRILLVDDEEAQVQSIRNMLKRLGYRVVSRTDPAEALKNFKKDPGQFDLVITDLTMPKLTGAQLAGEIHRLRPDLPAILCTGFSERVDANEAQAMGIGGFLMKPFTIREMAAAIQRALKKDQAPR